MIDGCLNVNCINDILININSIDDIKKNHNIFSNKFKTNMPIIIS